MFFKIELHEKETSTQLFFCEICKTFQNTFFYRTAPAAASANHETKFGPTNYDAKKSSTTVTILENKIMKA